MVRPKNDHPLMDYENFSNLPVITPLQQLGTGEYEVFQSRLDNLNDTQIPYATAIEKKD